MYTQSMSPTHARRNDDDLLGLSGGSREEMKGRRTVRWVKAILILALVALGLRWFFATRVVAIRNNSSKDMGALLVEIDGVASRQVSIRKGERWRFMLNGWPDRDTGLRILDRGGGVVRELIACGYESKFTGSSHYVVVLLDDGKSICEPIFSFNPLFNLD